MIRRVTFVLAACCLLATAGCGGIDLGDNPGPDVPKQAGPLTALPAHLKNGASE